MRRYKTLRKKFTTYDDLLDFLYKMAEQEWYLIALIELRVDRRGSEYNFKFEKED